MKDIFLIIGYIAVWPSNRIVKVKIERCNWRTCGYSFIVVSLEKGVKIGTDCYYFPDGIAYFYIADPSLITLYKSREEGEKAELEKLHDQHLTEKREMRKQEKRVKLANKRIAEYKRFKQIHTVFDVK